MAGREFVRGSRREGARTSEEAVTVNAVAPQAGTEEIDDLLGEIDAVLEANAEDFVQGFVQKGGQ